MNALLIEVDAWVTALVLAAVMLAAWTLGRWRGRRLASADRAAAAGKIHDASLAVLGLLLAFTFSLALAKHEQRRQMVVTDSNAIGDFHTCASLLKEPVRGKLQAVIRAYVDERLAIAKTLLNEAELQKKLVDIQEMHNQMQTLVEQVVNDGTPVTVPLVNTLNEVTSSHAARLAAARDRLPWSIVLLLFLTALMSIMLVGRQQGEAGEREIEGTLGFIALICMIVWVTLDLNQPNRGAITVSQEPLQRLQSGMK